MTSIKGAIVSTVSINPRYIFVKVPGSGNMGSKVQGSTFRGYYKSEPQNFEGWIRIAQPILFKNDSIPSFDVRHSIFCGSAVRFSLFNPER
jgi:hypothetical protein